MRLLLVLGMHRSGTSAVAGLLSKMGVELGPEDELLPPAPDNPVGFFENRRSYNINRRLLQRFGGNWASPPLLPTDWLTDERIVEERKNAASLLAEFAERADDWVAIKDPRLCLLLPFWASLHPIDQVFHVIRHPFDVASSLQKRDGLDLDTGAKLWLRYVGAAFRNRPDAIRIQYDELIESTDEVARRIEVALGSRTATEGVQSKIVRPDLRHEHDSRAFHSDLGDVAHLVHQDLVRSGGPSDEIGLLLRVIGQPGMGLLSERDVSRALTNGNESLLESIGELESRLLERETELRDAQDQKVRLSTSIEDLTNQLRDANLKTERLEVESGKLRSSLADASDRVVSLLEQLGESQSALLEAQSNAIDQKLALEVAQSEAKQSQKRARRLQGKVDASEVRAEDLDLKYKRLRRRRAVRLALGVAGFLSPVVRPIRAVRRRKREKERSEEIRRLAGDPLPQPADFSPRWPSFDSDLARATQRILDARYELDPERFDGVTVSVILPTYNRRRLLPSAIKSVLNQTHRNWELIIVDDGSTDGSREAVANLIDDDRIQWVSIPNGGVSAARNVGLEHATGEYVAYLDSDNRWTRRHLRAMVVALETTNATGGYTALNAESLDGDYLYTRGASFEWTECRSANYVDMNVFVHRRDLLEKHDRFQTELKRMVDWELILRLTQDEDIQYVPVLGCRYRDHDSEGRISTRKPMAFDAVLKTRIPEDGGRERPWDEVARRLSLSFAIKIPAPKHKKDEWGDYHYAVSLCNALEALGQQTRIDFLGEWDSAGYADVNLVLRGLTPYTPAQGALNLMWNISHPDKVPVEEYQGYDLVYTASQSYTQFLRLELGGTVDVRYLPQATDRDRFNPGLSESDHIPKHPLLFVGNSRKEYRDIVQWAVEAGLHPAVYGANWEEFLQEGVVQGENIPNDELGRYYANADVVLNDHWPSMRDFGFVSNRVFDVLATGTKLLSDKAEALERMFGSTIAQVGSASELRRAVEETDDPSRQAELSAYVLDHHGFQRRAEVIVDDILEELGLERVHGTGVDQTIPSFGVISQSPAPKSVGLVITHGRDGPQSSAFIRLINPLTQERIVDRVRPREIDYKDPEPADVVLVQRTSIPELDDVHRFLNIIRGQSSHLVIDVDDAFLRIDRSHPEYERYVKKNRALEVLLEESDQAWFSTPLLAELYAHTSPDDVRIMRNSLDPRPWRSYRRKTDPVLQQGGPPRILYMGTATHDADFVLVRDALLELANDFDFTMTVIGALRNPPNDLPWLEVVNVPEGIGVYPQFVRWLKSLPPFDIGVSPLVPSEFNGAKSDIKFLDYSALGLVSVLSEGPAYQEVIDKNLAVGAGPDDWTQALGSVLEDLDSQREMSEAATDYLWSERSATESAERMVDALDDLGGRKR